MTATTTRFAAYGYPMAEQDSGGNWVLQGPDSESAGDWGTFRLEAGATWDCSGGTAVLSAAGTDVTTVNSVPTILESLSFGDYGETTGQFTIPEAAPFDDLSAIGITPGGNVDIYRVLPAAQAAAVGTAEVPYWHGIVASLELADGPGMTSSWSVQLVGALYGEAMVRAHQPLMLDTSNDVGTWAGRSLDPAAYSRPLPSFERFTFDSATTGIEVRYRGSRGQTVIDYLDELLALAQDNTNGKWEIARAYQTITGPTASMTAPRPRHYYLRAVAANMAAGIQQSTVFAGGYGVSLSLTSDATETPTAIYGEGVHPTDNSDLSGSRWRNARYPMLTTTAPANPSRISGSTYPIQSGDTDADFTADVITQLTSQLRLGGWPDVVITDTFDATVGAAITALKEDTGYANTNPNIGGTAEWAYIWSTGSGYTDLSSGFFLPLYDTNPKWEYAPDGDVIGTAAGYDPAILRVDRQISYGDGIPKSRARKNARRVLNTTADVWMGTITLTSDPTDENGTGRSRLDIREGSWVQVNNLNGGTYRQFYVSGVTQQPESDGFPTVLQVTTVPYTLLDLSARLERNRAAKTDPARAFYNQRTATVRPFRSAVGWDAESGAGILPTFSAAGSVWSVQRFAGAQFGSIGSLRIDTSSAVGYCFAVFGGSVAGTALDALIPNPLGTVAGDYPSHWQHPDNLDQLAQWGFVEAWGSLGESAGFYPGAESIGTASAGGTATGALEDAGSWTFASLDPPFLWAAIWPNTSGTVSVTGRMRIVVEE